MLLPAVMSSNSTAAPTTQLQPSTVVILVVGEPAVSLADPITDCSCLVLSLEAAVVAMKPPATCADTDLSCFAPP